MPRGVHMACTRPGHLERRPRADGFTYCVACKKEQNDRRLVQQKWERVAARINRNPQVWPAFAAALAAAAHQMRETDRA